MPSSIPLLKTMECEDVLIEKRITIADLGSLRLTAEYSGNPITDGETLEMHLTFVNTGSVSLEHVYVSSDDSVGFGDSGAVIVERLAPKEINEKTVYAIVRGHDINLHITVDEGDHRNCLDFAIGIPRVSAGILSMETDSSDWNWLADENAITITLNNNGDADVSNLMIGTDDTNGTIRPIKMAFTSANGHKLKEPSDKLCVEQIVPGESVKIQLTVSRGLGYHTAQSFLLTLHADGETAGHVVYQTVAIEKRRSAAQSPFELSLFGKISVGHLIVGLFAIALLSTLASIPFSATVRRKQKLILNRK